MCWTIIFPLGHHTSFWALSSQVTYKLALLGKLSYWKPCGSLNQAIQLISLFSVIRLDSKCMQMSSMVAGFNVNVLIHHYSFCFTFSEKSDSLAWCFWSMESALCACSLWTIDLLIDLHRLFTLSIQPVKQPFVQGTNAIAANVPCWAGGRSLPAAFSYQQATLMF